MLKIYFSKDFDGIFFFINEILFPEMKPGKKIYGKPRA